MAGGQPIGAEILAARAPSQSAHGHRRVGGAENRGAGFWDRFARTFRHNRQSRYVGGFALIRGHTQRGIAFEMFNRAKPFLIGLANILDRHIVL